MDARGARSGGSAGRGCAALWLSPNHRGGRPARYVRPSAPPLAFGHRSLFSSAHPESRHVVADAKVQTAAPCVSTWRACRRSRACRACRAPHIQLPPLGDMRGHLPVGSRRPRREPPRGQVRFSARCDTGFFRRRYPSCMRDDAMRSPRGPPFAIVSASVCDSVPSRRSARRRFNFAMPIARSSGSGGRQDVEDSPPQRASGYLPHRNCRSHNEWFAPVPRGSLHWRPSRARFPVRAIVHGPTPIRCPARPL